MCVRKRTLSARVTAKIRTTVGYHRHIRDEFQQSQRSFQRANVERLVPTALVFRERKWQCRRLCAVQAEGDVPIARYGRGRMDPHMLTQL